MSWFFIALIAPILYAITNHIDKYILEKYFKSGEGEAVALLSALGAVIVLPAFLFVDADVFSIGLTSIVFLIANGALGIACLVLYMKALRNDDPSTVVPYYQTIPLFGFALGYFVLGEVLGLKEIIAGILILAGTTIISLDFRSGALKFKRRVAILMLSSSFIYAASGVIFKMVAVDEGGFWSSLFWIFIGNILSGIVIFAAVKNYREQFLGVFRANSKSILSVSLLNELIFISAEGTYAFAILLAPIALVMAVNGFQPAFVFLISIGLIYFFPKLNRESMTLTDLAQKILAIGLIVQGSVLLSLNI